MGILGTIKAKFTELTKGGHNINPSQVLRPTAPDVINPVNPGTWQSVRTAPINHEPRYFTKPEADALKQLATNKTEGARQTRRAYRSLGKIEDADALVHQEHRRYIRNVADAELTKQRSNARTARHLHAIRPEYAKLGYGLETAENNAQQRIEQLRAKIQEA
jgi:hypothetical protein